MRIFTWNCRGLGKPRAVRELTSLVSCYKLRVVGLLETKIDKRRLENLRCKLGFKHGFVVERKGLAGGFVLWWKEDIEIQMPNFSSFHIDTWLGGPWQSRITLF